MSFSIEGKTAIVTGAANGVGLAIARHFVRNGANVMFADMDEPRLQDEIGDAAEDGNVRYFAGDLRERLTMTNLVSATVDAFDRVDILVNGSRQIVESDPLNPDDDTVSTLLTQNTLTALQLSQVVARRMIKQAKDQTEGQAGSIINISSIAAHRTQPQLLAYSISMAATEQMTRSLALALAPHRIRVNAVAFGSVMSASLKQALKDHDDYREDIEAHTPLHRIAAPGELASAVHYLASEASGFITGDVMTVDGGRSLLDPVSAPVH